MSEGQEITCCPYNNSHKFNKSKFLWHLSRCKDREKVEHLYTKCKYNSLHIFLKERIAEHQSHCPDQESHLRMVNSFKEIVRSSNRGVDVKKRDEEDDDSPRNRSRSREKQYYKKEEEPEGKKNENLYKGLQSCQDCVLEDCGTCQQLLKVYLVSTFATGEDQISKLLSKYRKL